MKKLKSLSNNVAVNSWTTEVGNSIYTSNLAQVDTLTLLRTWLLLQLLLLAIMVCWYFSSLFSFPLEELRVQRLVWEYLVFSCLGGDGDIGLSSISVSSGCLFVPCLFTFSCLCCVGLADVDTWFWYLLAFFHVALPFYVLHEFGLDWLV